MEKDGAVITLVRGAGGTFEEYRQMRQRLTEKGEDSKKPVVADIHITLIGKNGKPEYIDEIVVRGRNITATLGAEWGRLPDGQKSANYYSFAVGEDARDVAIVSPDRKLMHRIMIDFLKKTKELGDEQDAFAWLRMDSPYAKMKNPYDGRGLFMHGVPRSDMFKKKE